MSVSHELLCSFELLKPLDSSQLKSHIKKGRNKRANMLNSPVSGFNPCVFDLATNPCYSLPLPPRWRKAFDLTNLSPSV